MYNLEKFKNSFCSYEFVSNQQKLYGNLKEASIEIEVWHQDRFKKDMLVIVLADISFNIFADWYSKC